jgi:O-antigen/teichoic acid export membrane protein
VGIYLGPQELGLYRVGNTFVMMIFGFMFGPVLPVLYSHFSKIQHDLELLRKTLFKVMNIITFLAIPTAFFIVANSNFIADVVFGDKWQGVELVISVLALMHGYSYIVGAKGEAYRAVGKPFYETTILALSLPFYLVGYWLSVQQGLEVFLWTRFGLAMTAFIVHLWVAKKAVNLSIKSSLIYILKISLICLPVVLFGNLLHFENVLLNQITIFFISSFILVISLFFVERNDLVPSILALINRKKATHHENT